MAQLKRSLNGYVPFRLLLFANPPATVLVL